MKKILIVGAAISALFAGSASAADMPVKAPVMPPPPPVYSWTGCYINAGVGYGMWTQDHSLTAATPGGGPNSFHTIDTTAGGRGWLGRFGGGCDYQLGGGGFSNFVIGILGDYDWMNLKGSLTTQGAFVGLPPTQADEKESRAWAIGGRIGYLIAPTALVFVDGGYARTRFDQMNLETVTGIAFATAIPAHDYKGWFIGSGFEYNFNWLSIPGLFWRTEYRYASYNRDSLTEFNVNTGLPAGNGGLGNVLSAQKNVQTVTTSLVWRFNLFGAPRTARY